MRTLIQNRFTAILAGIQLVVIFMLASCGQEPLDPAVPKDMQPAAPQTRITTMELEDNGITLQVFDGPDVVVTNQRITFRISCGMMTMFGDDKVKIEITALSDGLPIPYSYDPGMSNYYFFAQDIPGSNVKVTLVEHPEITANFFLPTDKVGVFMRVEKTDQFPNFQFPNCETQVHAVRFYADKACTERIATTMPMSIRVHLIKKATVSFGPSAHFYQDVTVNIGKGTEEICNNRLYTIHQTLPSGELLEDYYEYEFIRFTN